MADQDKVFTGAMALVVVGGSTIGKMKDIRGSEDTRRVRVGGLGTIMPLEVPVVEWAGSFSASYYLINWKNAKIPLSIRRDVQTDQQFEDYIVLQEEGVQVNVFRKVTDAVDSNGIPIPGKEPAFIIKGCFSEGESWNIAEGQVGGHDQRFQYIHPIIYPK